MPGILPGKNIPERVQNFKSDPALLANGKLRAYLADLVPRLRARFGGPLTYASLVFEQLDWGPFDYVGVDHYRDSRTRDRYVQMLEPFLATGKPVIVTEFGMRTFRGAESSGALGFGVTDGKRLALHTLPLIGRFVRPRLTGTFQRDEAMQAREVAETLDELERAGVAGALLSTFATPRATTDDDPRYDLDMDSMSLVKALPGGRHGTVYPDMPWEPKEAFAAVARHFGPVTEPHPPRSTERQETAPGGDRVTPEPYPPRPDAPLGRRPPYVSAVPFMRLFRGKLYWPQEGPGEFDHTPPAIVIEGEEALVEGLRAA